jgi:hypothetical protein
MNNEALRPHELAEQVADAGYEVVNGRVESERLANLIDRSQAVWRQLAAGQFEADEHGHVAMSVDDWVGDYQTSSGDHVDGLNLYFHDPRGSRTPLGSVKRLSPANHKATANVATGEGRSEPLLPSDPRWDAVVGVVERAIAQCIEVGKGES